MPPERHGPIFRCSHCDKSYSRREHLQRHQRSWTSPLVSSGSHFACSFGEQMRIKGPSNVLNATNSSIAGAAIDEIWYGLGGLIRCRRDLLNRHLLRHDSKKEPAPPSRVARDVIEFHVVSLLRREYMLNSQNRHPTRHLIAPPLRLLVMERPLECQPRRSLYLILASRQAHSHRSRSKPSAAMLRLEVMCHLSLRRGSTKHSNILT